MGGGGAPPPELVPDVLLELDPPVAPGALDDGVEPPSPAYCWEPADAPEPPNGLRIEPPPPPPPPVPPVCGTTPLVGVCDAKFEPLPPPEALPGLEALPTESTLPGKSRIVLTLSDVIAATPMAAYDSNTATASSTDAPIPRDRVRGDRGSGGFTSRIIFSVSHPEASGGQ